jgi:hypothetical protein
LLLGQFPLAGATAIGVAGVGIVMIYANRGSLDHLGRSVDELRPSRLTCLAPAAMLIASGLMIAVAGGDIGRAFRAIGLGLTSTSVALFGWLEIRRRMLAGTAASPS